MCKMNYDFAFLTIFRRSPSLICYFHPTSWSVVCDVLPMNMQNYGSCSKKHSRPSMHVTYMYMYTVLTIEFDQNYRVFRRVIVISLISLFQLFVY